VVKYFINCLTIGNKSGSVKCSFHPAGESLVVMGAAMAGAVFGPLGGKEEGRRKEGRGGRRVASSFVICDGGMIPGLTD
jgi:hypothetical protein